MGNNGLSSSSYNSSNMSIKRLFKPKPTRTILLVGLNNSGKTTLLCNLVISMLDYARDMENIDQVSTCPTPGLSLVEFQQGRIKWRVWDMSGQGRFRNLWAYYSGHVQGIVFCVDVTDGDRIATARDELQSLLDQPRVKDMKIPIIIFANKADLGNGDLGDADNDNNTSKSKSLSLENVRMALGVDSMNQNQKVKVMSSSGLTGTGVSEGFQWLNEAIRSVDKGEV
ncbi:hypothetical protein TrCOL_g12964 [Triparma columacea]|uniref:Uncharacterized protein n=1 Tax=Triparma columacea TaxID=722753 RepID=A0A9W7LC40_9STRA|nr:hypothetical protein TrCOL_g12964 [Triparma columacea]